MMKIITLTIAALVWIASEAFLILKDKAEGKGKVGIDQKTRNYNTISTIIALTLSPIIGSFSVFEFSSIKIRALFWAGIVVMFSGFFLRHWSISILGNYFRTTIELEKGQKVIQNGPYKYIRHPAYSGIILFFIGYGLTASNWLSIIIAVILPTISLLYRIRIEEVALENGLGIEYKNYQEKTKKIIPGIW